MPRRGRPPSPDILTPREAVVVDEVAQGLTNAVIAEHLGISEQGVKYHLNQVYAKLELGSREELIVWAKSRKRHQLPVFVAPLAKVGALLGAGAVGVVLIITVAMGGGQPSDPTPGATPAVTHPSVLNCPRIAASMPWPDFVAAGIVAGAVEIVFGDHIIGQIGDMPAKVLLVVDAPAGTSLVLEGADADGDVVGFTHTLNTADSAHPQSPLRTVVPERGQSASQPADIPGGMLFPKTGCYDIWRLWVVSVLDLCRSA